MPQFEKLMHVAMTATPETVKYGLYVDVIACALFREHQGDPFQSRAFAMGTKRSYGKDGPMPDAIRHLVGGTRQGG
ncbi:hypothetical protein [Rhizorhabdus sp. FW153]|uniref:hypothetical protein n=1 Tax=Rhizorhabdus sp. FW153 TaxID=3400216 RepID=UPI003CE68B64